MFVIQRDGGDYSVFVNWGNPSTGQPYDTNPSSGVTAVAVTVYDTSTTPSTAIASSAAMAYDSGIKLWKLSRPVSDLDGLRFVAFRFVPTRGSLVSPANVDEFTRVEPVADLLERQDEIEAKVDTLISAVGADGSVTLHQKMGGFTAAENLRDILGNLSTTKRLGQVLGSLTETDTLKAILGPYTAASSAKASIDQLLSDLANLGNDFDAFVTVNQNEHDDTQARISQVGASSKAQVSVPPRMIVPETGTQNYRLWFTLRDLDNTPATLVDPDGDIVNVFLENQAGATPAGVTVASTMTRESLGQFYVDVAIGASAVPEDQLLFTFDYEEGGIPDAVVGTAILVNVNTQLAAAYAALQYALALIGLPTDASTESTLFGRQKGTREVADLIHGTDVPALDAQVLTRESESAAVIRANADIAAHAATKAVADAIRATDIPALDAQVLTRESEAAASVRAAADIAAHATTKAVADEIRGTDVPAINENVDDAKSAVLGDLAIVKGAGFTAPADTLAGIRDAIDAGVEVTNPGAVADAVWDEQSSGHASAGSFGRLASDAKAQADAIKAVVDLVRSADVPAIQAAIALVQAAIAEMDADGGETGDTGGSATAGSRSAKLNAALSILGAVQAATAHADSVVLQATDPEP